MAGTLWSAVVGLVAAGAVAGASWGLRLLTRDGAAAALVVGGAVVVFGGWRWAALLALFFATGSALTRWGAAGKPQPEHRRGRSAVQVAANGAIAAGLAVWNGLAPSPGLAAAFAGAVAGSTADTWATEIGLLSPTPPRLITTGQIVVPGRSGGVTWLGTAGGLLGAVAIGAAASLWLQTPLLPVATAGTAAMLLDSLLGATLELRWRWLDNNTVNLFATASGALIAGALS